MAIFKLLCPAGLGDYHWLWTKLSTTSDKFIIEYANASPDRLSPFLALLPKDKILGYGMSKTHRCFFNVHRLEMTYNPSESQRITHYSQLRPDILNHVEPNTHLERGNRIETWLPDLPNTDFHYKIEGVLENPVQENIFIVHLSSTHTFRIWKHYDVPTWVSLIELIQMKTGWTPVFIGGEYDDFANQVYEAYHSSHLNLKMTNLIGKTPELLPAIHLVQQCKFFFGAVSSGMTMLANCLKVPSLSYWPREKLPQSWNAPGVPYEWLMWKNPEEDKVKIEKFIEEKLK